jgi:hypothetical protein
MATKRPNICIVDDEPDRLRYLLEEFGPLADIRITHPEDLEDHHLANSDLVLVDYILEHWPARDHALGIALQPLNGLGLVAVLRNHVQERLRSEAPTAFAIHSAHLADLSPGMPPQALPQAVARSQNLEWVFPKDKVAALVRQATSLAAAVQALSPEWSLEEPDRNVGVAQQLLRLPSTQPWSVRAWEDIEDAHAPIHELSQWTHGLAFLRWMLHRILPYPCFLRDEQYLAARLHVSAGALREALGARGALWDALEPYRYAGILDDFLGPRWWRAGVEAFLWEATNGKSFDPDSLHELLATLHGTPLEPLPFAQPVVCLGFDLSPLPALCDAQAAILVQPDDWPPYADHAWAHKEMIDQSARLKGIVFRGELGSLG